MQAMGAACRKVLVAADVRPEEVVALSVDTTCCSVVALDERGEVGIGEWDQGMRAEGGRSFLGGGFCCQGMGFG